MCRFFAARYMLNAAAVVHRVPLIHGAVYGYEGRLASVVPGKTACLECIYLTLRRARCFRFRYDAWRDSFAPGN